ncbi:hypothetical protein [Fusobacterium sp.]|uniref:hypothetical protein n=1 Tax=Fusobacterium sp. TaxID=68766 RepID=UPI00260BDD50|nr:hypothetical protein [Fusobacterium sp.]
MFEYKIQLNGKDLPKYDEEILVTFLKMLDFSAEYLSSIYSAENIKFCPQSKEILVFDLKKHENKVDDVANSYGFKIEIRQGE